MLKVFDQLKSPENSSIDRQFLPYYDPSSEFLLPFSKLREVPLVGYEMVNIFYHDEHYFSKILYR